MKVRSIIIVIFLLGIFLHATDTVVDDVQNSRNQKFLILLNDNLLSTIQMMEAFNEQASEIYLIENGEVYNGFLMDMTMQCSNLIGGIRQAETMTDEMREKQITALLASIKPDVQFIEQEPDNEILQNTHSYLDSVNINLNDQLATLFKLILEEEKNVLNIGRVTQNYLRLHSHHFLFSLIIDFIEPADRLSPLNAVYLADIVRSVDSSLPKQ